MLSTLGSSRFVAFLAVAAIVAIRSSGAPDGVHRFEKTNDHFAITLAEGWKELSPELAAAFADPFQTRPADKIRAYAFELRLPDDEQTEGMAPLILVQVLSKGRLPDHSILMLRNTPLRQKAVVDKLKREGILERDVFETVYDTNRHFLRVSLAKTDQFAGRLRALDGVFFTEKGSINVSCVAQASDYEKWSDAFAAAMESFYIDPAIRYRFQPGTESPLVRRARFRFELWLVFTGGAVILAIVKYRANRVMSDEI